MAEIGADGGYALTTFTTEDGALLGEHRVTIKATRVHFSNQASASSPANIDSPTQRVKVEWLVPQRYENAETSPLTAKVEQGKNTIDFNLPAD